MRHDEGLELSEKYCKYPFCLNSLLRNYRISMNMRNISPFYIEMGFIETSALSATNVEKAFNTLVLELFKITRIA